MLPRISSPNRFVPFNQLSNPVPGDLIEFDRETYYHWAMYSDIPGYVFNIDVENIKATEALITLRSLEEVAGSSRIQINNMEFFAKRKKGLKPKTGAEAVAAARKDLGRKVPYNFTSINCEYYSTNWKYGKGFSIQGSLPRCMGYGMGIMTAGGLMGAALGSVVPGAGTFVGFLTGTMVGYGCYCDALWIQFF